MPPKNTPENHAPTDSSLPPSVGAEAGTGIPINGVEQSDAFRRGQELAVRAMAGPDRDPYATQVVRAAEIIGTRDEDVAREQGWFHPRVTRDELATVAASRRKTRPPGVRPPTTGPAIGEDAEPMVPWAATPKDNARALRMLPGVRASLNEGKPSSQQ